MFAEERRIRICELLNEKTSVGLGELTDMFNVSSETIRRDLLELEKLGRLQRTHGGAVSVSRMLGFKDLSVRIGEYQAEKHELSKCAAAQICDGDSIAIDSGSTAAEFAKVLGARSFSKLTVVTHSADVISILRGAPNIQIISCGGYYMPDENSFWGQFTLDILDKLHVKKLFLCPSAISLSKGIMDYSYPLIQVQQKYLSIADHVFILADSSKLEHTAQLKLSDIQPGYTIITDSAVSEEIKLLYKENNINILI